MAQLQPGGTVDVRLAKALSHPLRQRLLVALVDDRVASPSDLADELGERLGDVSYHTKQLHQAGLLELVRTERRRGAIKHFYTANLRFHFEDEEWRDVAPDVRRRVAGDIVADIWRDVSRASQEGRLSGEDIHLSRTPLILDRQALGELNALLRDVAERALEIQAAGAARAASAAAGERPQEGWELAILHFPHPPPAASDRPTT